MTDDPTAVTPVEPEPAPVPVLEPLPVPMARIIEVGLGLWVAALVVVMVVPSLHEGTRSWWPWGCVAGFALGLVGYAYVRRGRGNAAEATGQEPAPADPVEPDGPADPA